MSAHCNDCGTDLVYGTGEDWMLGSCPVCTLRAANAALTNSLGAAEVRVEELEGRLEAHSTQNVEMRAEAESPERFLQEAIAARLAGNAACGVDDPYPHDVEFKAKLSAYYALGGSEDHARTEWERIYALTSTRLGGGDAS